jgi:hypothetical protein
MCIWKQKLLIICDANVVLGTQRWLRKNHRLWYGAAKTTHEPVRERETGSLVAHLQGWRQVC